MDKFSARVNLILQCLPIEIWRDIESEAKSLLIKYNASVVFHKKLMKENDVKSASLWIQCLWKIKQRETHLLKKLHELILSSKNYYMRPFDRDKDVDDKDDGEPDMYDYFARK